MNTLSTRNKGFTGKEGEEVNVVFVDRNNYEFYGTMLLSDAGPAGAVVWNNTLYIYRNAHKGTFYFYELSIIKTVAGTSINPRAIVIDWNQAK